MSADRRGILASKFTVYRTIRRLIAICYAAALCRLGGAVHLERSFTVYGRVVFGAVTHVSLQGSNDISVTWQVKGQDLALTPYYMVTYSYRPYKACDENAVLYSNWLTKDYPADVTSITLYNLQPWQDYIYKLKASKLFFRQEEWVNGTFQTHYVAPTGSAQNLRVKYLTHDQATVMWDQPTCQSRGGPVSRYDLELTSTQGLPQGPLTMDAGKATEVVIKRLQPDTHYLVRVRYVNADGEGPYSGDVGFLTMSTDPSIHSASPPPATVRPALTRPTTTEPSNRYPRSVPYPPTSLLQTGATRTCVSISWVPSPATDVVVYGYDIYDLTTEPLLPTTVPLSSPGPSVTKSTVCDLKPGHSYKLGITARGMGSNRSQPTEVLVKTEGGAPNKPHAPRVQTVTDTTVVVELFGVKGGEGPVTGYHIWVTPSFLTEEERVLAGIASPPKGYVPGDRDEPVNKKPLVGLAQVRDGQQAAGYNVDKGGQERGTGAGAQMDQGRVNNGTRDGGQRGGPQAGDTARPDQGAEPQSSDTASEQGKTASGFPSSGAQSINRTLSVADWEIRAQKDVKRNSGRGVSSAGANQTGIADDASKSSATSKQTPLQKSALQLPYLVPHMTNVTATSRPENNATRGNEGVAPAPVNLKPPDAASSLGQTKSDKSSLSAKKTVSSANVGSSGRKVSPSPVGSEGKDRRKISVQASFNVVGKPYMPLENENKGQQILASNSGQSEPLKVSKPLASPTTTVVKQQPGRPASDVQNKVSSADTVTTPKNLKTQNNTANTPLSNTIPALFPSGSATSPVLGGPGNVSSAASADAEVQAVSGHSMPDRTTDAQFSLTNTAVGQRSSVSGVSASAEKASDVSTGQRDTNDSALHKNPILQISLNDKKSLPMGSSDNKTLVLETPAVEKALVGRSVGNEPIGKSVLADKANKGGLATETQSENSVVVERSAADPQSAATLSATAGTDLPARKSIVLQVTAVVQTPVLEGAHAPKAALDGLSASDKNPSSEVTAVGKAPVLESSPKTNISTIREKRDAHWQLTDIPQGHEDDQDRFISDAIISIGSKRDDITVSSSPTLGSTAYSPNQNLADTKENRSAHIRFIDMAQERSSNINFTRTKEKRDIIMKGNATEKHVTKEKRASKMNLLAHAGTANVQSADDCVHKAGNPIASRHKRNYDPWKESTTDPPPSQNPEGYIAAELQFQQLQNTAIFIVGDGRNYNGYTNTPLSPYKRYNIYLRAISVWYGSAKYSISDPAVVTMPKDPTSETDDSNAREINIIIISVMVTFAIMTLVFVSVWRICHQTDSWRVPNPPTFYPISPGAGGSAPKHMEHPPPLAAILPPVPSFGSPMLSQPGMCEEQHWSSASDLSEPRFIVTGRELLPPSQVIAPSLQMSTSSSFGTVTFRQEYMSLPNMRTTNSRSAGQFHPDRNRNPSILPFDATRVVLDHDGTGAGDYYNASYIQGATDDTGRGVDYIVGQSPFDDASVVDLWRLIYQNGVTSVVVMSRVIEDGMLRCMQYWPEMGKADYGPFKVSVVDQFTYADFTERLVSVKQRKRLNAKVLLVRIFVFSAWPDHGMPQDACPLLELRGRVRKMHGPVRSPVLVHCETGAGRSAVYIALDVALTEYLAEGQVSLFEIVSRMRGERPRMVQSYAQYVFIYDALFEELHAGDTCVGEDLRDRYEELTRRNPNTGRSYLKDQFILLQALTSAHQYGGMTPLGHRGLSNSVPDLIPAKRVCYRRPTVDFNYSSNRWTRDDDGDVDNDPYDYVVDEDDDTGLVGLESAVFVDGYRRQNEFIMVPSPVPGSVFEFWQLVYDNNVQTIVTMADCEGGRGGGEFWPAEGTRLWDPFFVELTAVAREDSNVSVRSFKLVHMHRTRDKPRYVRQFHFHAWGSAPGDPYRPTTGRRGSYLDTSNRPRTPGVAGQWGRGVPSCPPPSSKAAFLDLLQMVKQWQQQASADSTPVLVHCRDGSTCSGLFVALSLVVSRMEEEGHISIYRIARRLRKRCPNAINTLDQYKFLYKALWDYMNLRMRGGRYTESLGPSLDSPAPESGTGHWHVRSTTADETADDDDALNNYNVEDISSTLKSRSLPVNRVLFSDKMDTPEWSADLSDKSSTSSSSDTGSPLCPRHGVSPRGQDAKATSPRKFEYRHVQVDSYSAGSSRDNRPPRPDHEDDDVFRFKPHSLYPKLDTQASKERLRGAPVHGTAPSSPYRSGPARLQSTPRSVGAGGSKSSVLSGRLATRSLPPSPARSPSPAPAPRRTLHSPTRTHRPGTTLVSPRQRYQDHPSTRPAVSPTRPAPSLSPQRLLAELDSQPGSGDESGALKSESVLQEITEMMDHHGMFYRQELTDRVLEFSSASTRSDTRSDTN